MTRYLRTPPRRGDEVAAMAVAGLVAVGVGAATWYVTRLLLSRTPVHEGERPDRVRRRVEPEP